MVMGLSVLLLSIALAVIGLVDSDGARAFELLAAMAGFVGMVLGASRLVRASENRDAP